MIIMPRGFVCLVLIEVMTAILSQSALAGPPFLSDDPEPTDYRHFEIYGFAKGVGSKNGTSGSGGIDFNYGATPDIQLTATLPIGFDTAAQSTNFSPTNVELAVKYRLLHQTDSGVDVALFPRIILPTASSYLGDPHSSVLLPIWLQKDLGNWSAFGGGGCQLSGAGRSHDVCFYGGVLNRQLSKTLQIGLELYHQTADQVGTPASTNLGIGGRLDLNETYHLLGYIARDIQNTRTNDVSWYSSILFTF